MSEMPEDIREAAYLVAADIATNKFKTSHLIANAILAERQRCADVAEGFRQAHDTGSGFDSQPARATAEAIRDAILA